MYTSKDYNELMESLKLSTFEGVFLDSLTEHLIENQRNTFNFKHKMCKDYFATISVVLYFSKNHFLVPAVDSVISSLESGGLIEHWHFNYINKRFLNIKDEAKCAQKMTVEHLKGCFEIWACGCLLAFVSFLGEIIFVLCRNIKKHF